MMRCGLTLLGQAATRQRCTPNASAKPETHCLRACRASVESAVFQSLLISAIRSTFPGNDQFPAVDPAPLVAQMWRESPPLMRLAMAGSALAFHLSPLLTVYVPLPAFLLPAGLRDRHANALASHPLYLLRQSMLMVKTVGGLAWGADPTIRRRLAMQPYPPDPGRHRTT